MPATVESTTKVVNQTFGGRTSENMVTPLSINGRRSDGRIFPWRERHEVYDWLEPLCKQQKVVFTLHMAWHAFGRSMRALGAHPRDIADAGTWRSEKSTMRYTQAPERAKDLLGRLKVDTEPWGKSRRKKRST